MPKTLVITPTYNEADNLETLVAEVFRVEPAVDMLVVDDNSPDGTGDVADRLAQTDTRLHVRHRASKLGLGSAYIEAFRWGLERDYETFVQMDTDMSHDPKYLPQLLGALDAGVDVAVGSRNVPGGGVEGWGPGRRLLSRGGSFYARTVLSVQVRDLTTGYKAVRREVLEAIDLGTIRSEGYSFLVETSYRALRAGFEIAEIPIVFVDRRAGQSKMSFRIFLEAIVMVPLLRLSGR